MITGISSTHTAATSSSHEQAEEWEAETDTGHETARTSGTSIQAM